MKRIFIAILALVMSGYLFASEKEVLGDGAKMEQLTAITTLLASPDQFVNKEVTVEGKIESVCDKAGCWMMLSSGDQRLRVKVKDGDMVFPFNARGKTAYATGKLEAIAMTQEKAIAFLQHMAEDAGETFDPASVTGDMTIYQLKPTGVTILR